jgi:hypothetical protein
MPEHTAPDVNPMPPSARERTGATGAPRIELSHSSPGMNLFAVSGARVPQITNKSPDAPTDAAPEAEVASEVVTPPKADAAPEVVTPPEADVVPGVVAPPKADSAPEVVTPAADAAPEADTAPEAVTPPDVPGPPATPDAPATPATPDAPATEAPAHVMAVAQHDLRVPSIERALSGPAKDRNLSWHGKVRIVAGAAPGPGARDQEALDRARARLPLSGPKRVLMLGCTSGAGQTVTTLMTGHILASLREQPVAAVDLHDGTLSRYSSPVAWMEEILGGKTPEKRASPRPDGLNPTPRDTAAHLDVIASHEPLKDDDERLLAEHLGKYYPLTMLDPGAAGLTKLLTITDQLVVVVPASVEAAGALADTRDWLDAHGFADLAEHSVTLINGVSKRSRADVAQAESVARGRCRAIVRVPWDDMLPVGVTGPSTLRPQTRVAYTALAGVLVAGMAAAPIRKKH